MGMRVLDAVWDLGRHFADRNIDWLDALRTVAGARAGESPVSQIVLQRARHELGDDWARRLYDAARTSTGLYIDDDPTEPGEHGGVTVNELIRRLTSARDASPAVGGMKIVIGPGRIDLDRIEVIQDARSDSGRCVVALRGPT